MKLIATILTVNCLRALRRFLMSMTLYADTFGSDDPTRATISFVTVQGAIGAGHQLQIPC